MRGVTQVIGGMAALLLMSGCRTATKVVEVPRVDLDVSGGNRGYLVGKPPEPPPQKTTRQMVETTIEVPSFYKPKHAKTPVSVEEPASAGSEAAAAAPAAESAPPGTYDTYVVQKGDSLWSIAAKPEIYGKASRWKRILDANRDVLYGKPDHIRPGMTLKIPRGKGHGASRAAAEDEGTKFKK